MQQNKSDAWYATKRRADNDPRYYVGKRFKVYAEFLASL
jgi:hypothetical protein